MKGTKITITNENGMYSVSTKKDMLNLLDMYDMFIACLERTGYHDPARVIRWIKEHEGPPVESSLSKIKVQVDSEELMF